MSCILRVSGSQLDVEALLTLIQIQPDRIWHRGEPRISSKPHGKCHEDSGVTFVASDANMDDFPSQLEDATKFLEDYGTQIAFIVAREDVEDVTLDFGIKLCEEMIHHDILTPRFLRSAALAGVAVGLSHYPCKNEPDHQQ